LSKVRTFAIESPTRREFLIAVVIQIPIYSVCPVFSITI
jgi:hypothetical protein